MFNVSGMPLYFSTIFLRVLFLRLALISSCSSENRNHRSSPSPLRWQWSFAVCTNFYHNNVFLAPAVFPTGLERTFSVFFCRCCCFGDQRARWSCWSTTTLQGINGGRITSLCSQPKTTGTSPPYSATLLAAAKQLRLGSGQCVRAVS